MPVVTILALEGMLDTAQKSRIIKGVTDAVVAVEGEIMRPITWVIFEELPHGHWAMGGHRNEPKQVKAIRDSSVQVGGKCPCCSGRSSIFPDPSEALVR